MQSAQEVGRKGDSGSKGEGVLLGQGASDGTSETELGRRFHTER